mgnify:CR=1 FL=1
MLREPIDLPPIVSVELIQISDKTNIPFAPKAREILEKVNNPIIKIYFHPKNKGKGAAIKSGRKIVSGEIILIP